MALENLFSFVVAEFRVKGKKKFKGQKTYLNSSRILIIEDEKQPNDQIIEQILNQLEETNCAVYFATYSSAQELLKKHKYKVSAILVLVSHSELLLKSLIKDLPVLVKTNHGNKIPIALISGNSFLSITDI